MAIKDVANNFNSHFIPLLLNFTIRLPNDYFFLSLFIANCLSLLSGFILIFVSWKTGPVWWTNISFRVMTVITILDYIVIPLTVTVNIMIYLIEFKKFGDPIK